jgi:hypothetical protein
MTESQSIVKMSKSADVGSNDQPEMLEKPVQELSDIELVEGKRSKKGLLLRPQPSNDPNDPLVSASTTHLTTWRLIPRIELAILGKVFYISYRLFLCLSRLGQQQ